MFGLMFFPDRGKGFAELLRVLSPRWQALRVELGVRRTSRRMMRTVFAALQPDEAPPRRCRPPVGAGGPRMLFEAEMREAGFIDIRIEPVTHGMTVEDVDRFWRDTLRAHGSGHAAEASFQQRDWATIETERSRRLRGALPQTCRPS